MGKHAANEVERIRENVLRGLAFSLLRDFNEKCVLITIIEYISSLTNSFTERAWAQSTHERYPNGRCVEKLCYLYVIYFLRDIFRHWILKL